MTTARPAAVKIDATYDPVAKRYKGDCPLCGYFAARAKRAAALHVLSQHVAYEHGREVRV